MKPILIAGTTIVNLALVAYTIAIIKFYRSKKATNPVCTFFALGVLLDITATIFMILGSSKGMVTLHGFIGYSSLLGMITETVSIFRFRKKYGSTTTASKKLSILSYAAYSWWVIAYITGALIVAFRH